MLPGNAIRSYGADRGSDQTIPRPFWQHEPMKGTPERMTTSYHATANDVNPILTAPLRSLLDLLRDLSARHGHSWARNEWLANRLNCTPRTITRQIAALIRAGYITARRVANERHISIAKKPETKRIKYTLRNPDTPPEMSTRCLPATLEGKTKENNIPAASTEASPNPLVADLQAHGVSAIVAERLASSSPDECRRQLQALKAQKGIQNVAGWLVKAIQGAFRHAQKKHDAPTARPKRYATSNPTPAAEAQTDAETAYDALSEDERQKIEQEASSKLPPIAKRSRYIVRAACIQHFRAIQDAAPRQDDPTAAALAFAPPVSPS